MYKRFSEEVAELLREKGALNKCPACGSEKLAVNPGIAIHTMYANFSASTAKCAIVVCENCGWIREHSLHALGYEIPEEMTRREFEAN